ncbi:hypothetical protein ABZ370_07670 [Streptomyces sp. NPDC005962]|uniref:hypothetical protein n=1 Tax=Streptomyces sp. NPDC005962 TaxID=3154466 RepID=UPI00340E8D4C
MTLTEPERRLREAFATGAKVDVRSAATPQEPEGPEDPEADGPGWGPERTVRAEVIRSLLLGSADTRPGETPVVHLVGARVTGRLRLVFAEVCCVLRLEKCWFEEPPQLYGATLHVTGFGGSYLPGLAVNAVTVAGNFDLMKARIRGPVNLADTRIDGNLLLQGAHISHPGGVALDGSRLDVGSGIVGRDGFHAEGAVVLTAATVARAVSFRDATIRHPAAHAVDARHIRTGELDLRTARVEGTVDLRHGRLDVWHLPTDASAPVHLDGLVYQTLEPHLPVARCLALVERDPDGYRPQPYAQLAATYQSIGPRRRRARRPAREATPPPRHPPPARPGLGPSARRDGRLRLPPLARRALAHRPHPARHGGLRRRPPEAGQAGGGRPVQPARLRARPADPHRRPGPAQRLVLAVGARPMARLRADRGGLAADDGRRRGRDASAEHLTSSPGRRRALRPELQQLALDLLADAAR